MMKVLLTPYDKNKVHIAKAIIPFFIILHHCHYLTGLGFFKNLGILLVSFFFLMSGYGLMTSYIKWGGGEYLKFFFAKRFLKILIPYWLSLFVWLIYKCLIVDGFNLLHYFGQNNVGDWLPNSWFVWIIAVAYFVFWLVFRLKYSLRTKLILIIILSIGYYMISCSLEIAQYWYRSSICIALGMLWRYYEDRIFSFLSSPKIYYVFPIICLGLFGVCIKKHWNDVTPLFTCAVFAWTMYSFKYSKAHKMVLFLSKVSYEVYLLQCVAISIVCYFTEITFIAVPLIFMVDIVLSYFVHELSGLIQKNIYCNENINS